MAEKVQLKTKIRIVIFVAVMTSVVASAIALEHQMDLSLNGPEQPVVNAIIADLKANPQEWRSDQDNNWTNGRWTVARSTFTDRSFDTVCAGDQTVPSFSERMAGGTAGAMVIQIEPRACSNGAAELNRRSREKLRRAWRGHYDAIEKEKMDAIAKATGVE